MEFGVVGVPGEVEVAGVLGVMAGVVGVIAGVVGVAGVLEVAGAGGGDMGVGTALKTSSI